MLYIALYSLDLWLHQHQAKTKHLKSFSIPSYSLAAYLHWRVYESVRKIVAHRTLCLSQL